jgi:predicted ATP-dependent endonuclease of OLD family
VKIKSITLNRFRGYAAPVTIEIDDLLVLVGKNDIGKSSIFEALDIFFNEGPGRVKLDKDDINKQCLQDGQDCIEIEVEFIDLPETILIDATNKTTLKDEFLLSDNDTLKVLKRFPNAGKEKVFIRALHPSNIECRDLLQKKRSELQTIVETVNIICSDKTKNASLRKAIWDSQVDLKLREQEIEVAKEDAKNIWDLLKSHMPLFTLFQSDRKNSDGDGEVQDPMRLAVREILGNADIQASLAAIADTVKGHLDLVAKRTLEKLNDLNPTIAKSLDPQIPDASDLKWVDVFKSVSITSDNDIPINKRGSGVKRLVLISFFQAEAERRLSEANLKNIVYAIEEPETAQHPEHQRALLEALIGLSKSPNTQVFLTTHSPEIVKKLDFENIRLVDANLPTKVGKILQHELPYPSLNEVNFAAFGEITVEYHNELYGFIEAEQRLVQYKDGKDVLQYTKIKKDGSLATEHITLTEYIRHQIHHPENNNNPAYTANQLQESVEQMRLFLQNSAVI